MKKRSIITFQEAAELSSTLQRKVFWANPFFLMQNCFLEDAMIFEDQGATKDPAILFFSDKYSDVSGHVIGVVFDEDLPAIRERYRIDTIEPSGVEYHYSSVNGRHWVEAHLLHSEMRSTDSEGNTVLRCTTTCLSRNVYSWWKLGLHRNVRNLSTMEYSRVIKL
jgi:hypothetical protein